MLEGQFFPRQETLASTMHDKSFTGIRGWLAQQGLEKYESVFAEHEITLDVLADLTESDIDRLGLPTGPRRRLIVAVQALASNSRLSQPFPAPQAVQVHDAWGSRSGPERRQLTIMFCDLVGSTELSQQLDPEQLRELMQAYYKACREVVARYEGYVAQYWGDGLMIYFGWPTANENDPERSVRAAVDLVQAIKGIHNDPPLMIRIGIATGPVVVGQSSDDDDSAIRLAVGETPNLASRLQSLAEPDEVIIAASTRQLIGAGFDLSDLGTHSLKGIAHPVRAWQVNAIRRAVGRFEAAHEGEPVLAILGRDEELSMLQRRWQQAEYGEGQVVLIKGEPGIGKSRLGREVRNRLAHFSHNYIAFECSQFHSSSSLQPLIEHLETAAGFARDDTDEQKLDKLEKILEGTTIQRAQAAPLIAALLSLPISRYPRSQLSALKQKERTLAVLTSQLNLRSNAKPLFIFLEDAQWIDPTSQEWLDDLVPRIKNMRALMLITFRPEFVPPWADQSHVTMLSLSRLGQREGARVVTNISGRPLPKSLLDHIVGRTDGVPLFLEELTKSVLESGILQELGGEYLLASSQAVPDIPVSLRDSLLARLDRLSPAKGIIEIGSCIGREFSFELVQRISNIHPDHLDNALRTITESGLVHRRGIPPHATYSFKHALIQDVAYDSMLKSKRQQLHATLARTLEEDFAKPSGTVPEIIAHHYTQSGDFEKAMYWWGESGKQAMRKVALREAVDHFERGLALVAQLPSSAEIESLELSLRKHYHAAITSLRGWSTNDVTGNGTAILELSERTNNHEAMAVGLWVLWVNTITQGRIEDSMEWSSRMQRRAAEMGDTDLEILGHASAMISHFYLGALLEAKSHGDRVLALYDPRHAERWMQLTTNDYKTVVGIWACQWLWMLGYPDQAVQVSDEKDEYARTLGHPFNLGFALSLGAYCFDYRREPEELFKRIEEADRLEREQSVPFVSNVMVRQAEGLARLRSGQYADAIVLLKNSIASWNEYGGHSRVPYLKSALAEAYMGNGEVDQGLRLIEECLEQIERPGWQERSHLAELLRLKACMLLSKGLEQEAETSLRASIDIARRQQAKSWELRSSTTLAELLIARGQRDAARAILSPVYHWFTEGFDTYDLKSAREILIALE